MTEEADDDDDCHDLNMLVRDLLHETPNATMISLKLDVLSGIITYKVEYEDLVSRPSMLGQLKAAFSMFRKKRNTFDY